MKFTHSVTADMKAVCAALDAGTEQVALARFGDGEEKICMGGTYHCTDGWVSKPDPGSRYRPRLLESLGFVHDAYHLGMRPPKTIGLWAFYARNMHTPPERVCDPCLFVNARWPAARAFFGTFRKRAFLVGSGKGVDYRIPANCIQPEYDYGPLLARLLTTEKPILLAAGPLANILVMEYLRAGGKQSIIDLGTVLDMEMFGGPTRRYQRIATAKKRRRKAAGARARRKRQARHKASGRYSRRRLRLAARLAARRKK